MITFSNQLLADYEMNSGSSRLGLFSTDHSGQNFQHSRRWVVLITAVNKIILEKIEMFSTDFLTNLFNQIHEHSVSAFTFSDLNSVLVKQFVLLSAIINASKNVGDIAVALRFISKLLADFYKLPVSGLRLDHTYIVQVIYKV